MESSVVVPSRSRSDLLVILCLCSLIVGLVPEVLLGMWAKPVPNATSVATFRDAGNDQITSDGAGPYQHNSGGVSAEIFAGSGDLILDLGGSTRSLNFDFTDRFDGAALNPVTGVRSRMHVEALGKMPIGTTTLKPVRFVFDAALPKHVLVFRDITREGTLVNGTRVIATRSGATTWDLEAVPATYLTNGQPDTTQAGDVGALFEENTVKGRLVQTVKGRYRMPFAVDVTCLTNCPQ